jgi:hypothetical protein
MVQVALWGLSEVAGSNLQVPEKAGQERIQVKD